MKKIFTSLLLALITQLAFTQIYVDQNVVGGNLDGSSWENAFADLESALSVTTPNQIWIAKGTYSPQYDANGAYFQLIAAHSLFGGFAGTETALSERIPGLNETILSGDINQDDDPSNLLINRADNALHVLYIPPISSDNIILDGLTISNGSSSMDGTSAESFLIDGAGILSYSPVAINNCVFKENFGIEGSSIFLFPTAQFSTIRNSSFSNNYAIARSAGIFLEQAKDVTIENCKFINSTTNRGMIYAYFSDYLLVKNCLFDNVSTKNEDWTAGIFNWQSTNTLIDSCSFNNLSAESASAIYFDGREYEGTDTHLGSVTNSTFSDLNSRDAGGTFFFKCHNTVDNCVFESCNAIVSAGAIYQGHTQFLVSNTTFDNNSAEFGGACSNYSSTTDGKYLDCEFTRNTCEVSGGAANVGFQAKIAFENCLFEENHSILIGGAYNVQNSLTQTVSENCVFNNNSSDHSGGAVNIREGAKSIFNQCLFTKNESGDPDNNSPSGFGGAIYLGQDITATGSTLIDKCEFYENTAYAVGGAVYFKDHNGTIQSSIFSTNNVLGYGNGGAISQNATDSFNTSVDIINCTITNNTGLNIGGISQWIASDDVSSNIHMNMSNCILHNENQIDYSVAEGSPTFTSLGGNMVLQSDMTSMLMAENDIIGQDPMFVDPAERNFNLQAESPAINSGVVLGAHQSDIYENPILGLPDKGAIESDIMSSSEAFTLFDSYFEILENPVSDAISLTALRTLDKVRFHIMTNDGKQILSDSRSGLIENDLIQIPFNHYASGVYFLVAETQGERIAFKIIKQ